MQYDENYKMIKIDGIYQQNETESNWPNTDFHVLCTHSNLKISWNMKFAIRLISIEIEFEMVLRKHRPGFETPSINSITSIRNTFIATWLIQPTNHSMYNFIDIYTKFTIVIYLHRKIESIKANKKKLEQPTSFKV